MEPYRPQVDRDVLGLIRSQAFTPRDFVIDTKGVCRLHPELARCVACWRAAAVEIESYLACFRDPEQRDHLE
jgi:CRISPR-associated protein Cas1